MLIELDRENLIDAFLFLLSVAGGKQVSLDKKKLKYN